MADDRSKARAARQQAKDLGSQTRAKAKEIIGMRKGTSSVSAIDV